MSPNPSTSTTSRSVVESLIIYQLNPILQGRQRAMERFESFQAAGDCEAAELERATLLFLELAYRDGLKLLRRAMDLDQGGEAAK